MKKFITLKLIQTGGYKILEPVDSKFYVLYETLEYNFWQSKFSAANLITWFMNEKRTVEGNELIDIRKEDGKIILHDMSDSAYDDTISPYELDPEKRFEMSAQNFIEILLQWEELRLSRPDTILMVIHEDNHVSLEIDPCIIKEYQNAGYVFDVNKN